LRSVGSPPLIDESFGHRTTHLKDGIVRQRWSERVGKQVLLEAISQIRELLNKVTMAHSTSSCFPHMLLWIEIGCCYWEVDDLKARMRLKHFTNGWPQ
jgi:hypothetical protein